MRIVQHQTDTKLMKLERGYIETWINLLKYDIICLLKTQNLENTNEGYGVNPVLFIFLI